MKTSTENLKKRLMLGLIYPAVLGNILYLVIGEIVKYPNGVYEFSLLNSIKFGLLFITLIFYFCDYLYITFTNEFGKLFFFLDCLFVVFLYITVYAIGIDKPGVYPHGCLIVICYFVFMVLYGFWDFTEYRATENEIERNSYVHTLVWEGISAGALLVLGILFLLGIPVPALLILIFLTAITIWFVKIVFRKYKFYKPDR